MIDKHDILKSIPNMKNVILELGVGEKKRISNAIGIDILDGESVDIVGDVIEVLKEIKSHKSFKTIPVVVLTSSSDDLDIKTAYNLGANSYIVKPVDFDKFIEVAAQIELYWSVLNKPYLSNS